MTLGPLRSHLAALALVFAVTAALSCGKGGTSTPTPQVAAAPSPSPSAAPPPSPSPSPSATLPAESAPDPEPSPDCIHGTHNGVASVSIGVYFLECGGERIPGSKGMTVVPVGCRIHFNATPRDGMGAPTCSQGWPVWQVGPEDLVSGNAGQTFTPAFTAVAEGTLSARCIVDGVRSDWLFLELVRK